MMKLLKYESGLHFKKVLFVLAFFMFSETLYAQTWLSGYCYRKSITIDNTKVSGSTNLTDFPLLLSITDIDLRSVTYNGNVESSTGNDIHITDASHTELEVEVESYTESNGEFVAWIKVPSLDYNDNTTLYIYYGKSGDTAPTSDVWDSNYAAVWHLNEDTGSQILDATSNNMDETIDGSSNPYSDTYSTNTYTNSIAGIVANARNFNNVGNQGSDRGFIEIPHSGSNSLDIQGDKITIEVWARMSIPAIADAPFVAKSASSNQESYMFGVQATTNGLNRRITSDEADTDNKGWHFGDVCGADGHYRYDDTYTVDADWHYFAMVYDGSDDDGTDATNLVTMIDGVTMPFSRTGGCDPYPYGDVKSNTGDLLIGKRLTTNRFYKGAMDEIRISNTARSEDWVTTTYNNINNPSSFYSIGDEDYPIVGGTATASNAQIDTGESTSITLTGHDGSATIQWQNSTDNSSFSDILSETSSTLSTGALTQTTYYRAKTTKDGCDAYSNSVSVEVRAAFNSSQAYRSIITIDHTKVECSSSLTNFPLLINISGNDDLKQSTGKLEDANAYDVIFTDASNTQLDHDLEYYNGTAGDLIAWLKIPTLYCDANTVIYMYYGDCGYAGGDQSTTSTFSNSYNGVYHLNDDPSAASQADRSGNANNGTNNNFVSDTRLTGQIGQAIEFDGSDDYVGFGTGPQVSGEGDRTYECWMQIQTFGANEGIFQAGDPTQTIPDQDFSLRVNDGTADNFAVEHYNTDDDFTLVSSQNNWRHVALVHIDLIDETYLYYDGVLHSTFIGAINTSAYAVELGRYNAGVFDGYMDEFRISSVARSSEWLKTQFNNQSSPGTFYSLEGEVSEFVWNGSVDTDWNDPDNWSTCNVPEDTDDIIVPIGLSNYPVLDQDRIANYVNINSGASLSLGGFTLTINDDFRNDGTFTHGNGKLVFGSSTEQTIKGSSSISCYDIEINKAGSWKKLETDISVDNVFTLTDGFLTINGQTLSIENNGSITGGSSTSFIVAEGGDCLTQKNIGATGRTGNVAFPIGSDTTSYTPMILNNGGSDDDFCAYVCDGVYSTGGCSGTAFSSKVVNKTWDITPTTGTGLDVAISLQWNDAETSPDFIFTDAFISHYSSNWSSFAAQDISAQSEPYILTQNNVTSFSDFAISSGDEPLPVELISFSAELLDRYVVQLIWQTANEINNERFDILRSTDEISFQKIGSIKGKGTSNEINNYLFKDINVDSRLYYYQLKQIDFDGEYEYSPIIALDNRNAELTTEIVLAGNPVCDELRLQFLSDDYREPVTLRISDILGKEIYIKKQVPNNQMIITALPERIEPGLYILDVTHSKIQRQQFKIIIE